MTKYTPNYNLDMYEETDVPNLADQYNDAMGKIDTAVHDVHGEVVETANKLITINETIATLNTRITEVNAELTALGITDAEGAAALLATINDNAAGVAKIPGLETVQGQHTQEINDNAAGVAKIPGLETVQGQHTQEINDVMGDIAKIEADYVNHIFESNGYSVSTMTPSPDNGEIYVATNANASAIKVFGTVVFTPGTYQRTVVAGRSSVFGVKVQLNTPLPAQWQNRGFNYSAFTWRYNTTTFECTDLSASNFYVGSDGNVYLLCSSSKTFAVDEGSVLRGLLIQVPMYSGLAVPGNLPTVD